MVKSILITQCLQNDFVKPIGRYDPLPNALHVGFEEARRLMGDDPEDGPVALLMDWAYLQPQSALEIIHIRDWHDANDQFQASHLHQFGEHCLKDSEGSAFAFPIKDTSRPVHLINSLTLNDIVNTPLPDLLDDLLASSGEKPVRVGLVGVWTEAKVTFLAYELRTRYPQIQLATCSALTASSSRSHHFLALEQLERLLGVTVFSSIGEFTKFLGGESLEVPLKTPTHADRPKISLEGVDQISDTDRELIRYLFRDCHSVHLRELTGGFSGNLVLATDSIDALGHQEVPHVVKIGPQQPIGKERAAFERVEGVLGNNAPRITDFADFRERGGIKYRYAAMGGGVASTFQKLYCAGLPAEKTKTFLEMVFEDQLGRFYRAAKRERANILDHYGIIPKYADPLREWVEKVLGAPAGGGDLITLPTGQQCPNPYTFYKHHLPPLFDLAAGSAFFSYIHGDLNGANIIIDDHENVWLIDFFHTGPGHVLRDLIKFENDLLYIFTPVESADDLVEAIRLTTFLLEVDDLGRPLPDPAQLPTQHPAMRRAYETIRVLRSFYPSLVQEDRNPLQLLTGQLRYAGHTLSFDESNHWQKLWALHTAGLCCGKIRELLALRGPLRVDWLPPEYAKRGKLGLTILPGRKDHGRDLNADLDALKQQGVTHVVPLLTENEFTEYGVEGLEEAYQSAGFQIHPFPILDQATPSRGAMNSLVGWMTDTLEKGAHVMVHCVGGLGRSGLVAAAYLISNGLTAEAAMQVVRATRSNRAIESEAQEAFLQDYETHP